MTYFISPCYIVKTFPVHKVRENDNFLNPPQPTPLSMSLSNIKMVPYCDCSSLNSLSGVTDDDDDEVTDVGNGNNSQSSLDLSLHETPSHVDSDN